MTGYRTGNSPNHLKGAAEADNLGTLRTAISDLEQRLGTHETNAESQAALVVQLTRHNASLVRCLFVLVLVSAVSGGIAIAALLLTILQ